MFFWVAKTILTPFLYIFFKPKVVGRKNKKIDGRVVILCNHKSFWDPVLLDIVFWGKKINFMAKSELFKNSFVSWVLKKLGAFEVKRGMGDLDAIKYAIKVLNDGKIFGIFPEGTRTKSGEIQKFEPGVAMIALKTNSPVIPIYIGGTYSLLHRAKVNIGDPVNLSDYCGSKHPTPQDVEEICEMLYQRLLIMSKQI